MAEFLRKLLRIGKLPTDMRTQVESEGVIHLAEYLAVVMRFTGHPPGRRSVGLIRGYGGSLALTNQRVLGTVSVLPGKSGRAVDHLWTANGAGTVHGTLSLNYKAELSADVLSSVPTRALTFDVPPKFVYSVLRIPRG